MFIKEQIVSGLIIVILFINIVTEGKCVELESISRIKCKEYGNLINSDTCVNRTETTGKVLPGEYPHMALLGCRYENGEIIWSCTGFLISDQFVMTAGHCVTERKLKLEKVRLGEIDYNSESDNVVDINVIDIIVHPNYSRLVRQHDVALVKLEQPIEFSKYIRPVCLPDKHDNRKIENEQLVTSGWGLLSRENFNPKKYLLHDKNIKIFPIEKCQTEYPPSRNIKNGISEKLQICIEDSLDSCQITGGSVLQIVDKDVSCMYDAIGIISFGRSVCINTPVVLTKALPLIDWIESIVWPTNLQ